jgi:hypothetical protein
MQIRPTFAFGEYRPNYRPNWGLPGMTPPEQTGAPVPGFARNNIAPGERVRAVIVAMYSEEVPLWTGVVEGIDLPMYEGSRVCGHGRVLWRAETKWPLPEGDEARFRSWLSEAG